MSESKSPTMSEIDAHMDQVMDVQRSQKMIHLFFTIELWYLITMMLPTKILHVMIISSLLTLFLRIFRKTNGKVIKENNRKSKGNHRKSKKNNRKSKENNRENQGKP